MFITATEVKTNLGKYLMLEETEDIYITRNGKVVAKLSNPYQDRVDVAKSLFGVLSNDMTLEESREEKLNKDMKGIIRRTASKLTRIVLFFDYERKELFCVVWERYLLKSDSN